MPKKAGPKRIDPETFRPTIFTAVDTNHSILFCRKRWWRGPNVVGAPPAAQICSEFFCFPVVIELTPVTCVTTQYVNRDLTWIANLPEAMGISERCAKVALAEAWHSAQVSLDGATMTGSVQSRVEAWRSHKKGVRLRNVATALVWDEWNREGISVTERCERLTSSGYPCTRRQLERFATEHGLDSRKAA